MISPPLLYFNNRKGEEKIENKYKPSMVNKKSNFMLIFMFYKNKIISLFYIF